MTYRFIQDLKAEIDALIPDNVSGLVTPAVMRAVLQDVADSLYARVAALLGDHTLAPVVIALTAVPTNFPALYNANFAGDPLLMTVNQVAGTITILKTGVQVDVSISLTMDGPVNNDIAATLFRNGVASQRVVARGQTFGAGERVTITVNLPTSFWTAGDVADLRLSAPGGPVNINVAQMVLTAAIQPTFAPL